MTEKNLAKTTQQLDHLAWLLDDCFRLPWLNWRFGLDAVIGLIPGFGDLAMGAVALVLLFRAFQFRLPGIVITRMIINTLIDIVIGSIPVVGDAFDFAWKSNNMNMKLFRQYSGEPGKSTLSHWIFLASLVLGFLGLCAGVIALVIYFFYRLHFHL